MVNNCVNGALVMSFRKEKIVGLYDFKIELFGEGGLIILIISEGI